MHLVVVVVAELCVGRPDSVRNSSCRNSQTANRRMLAEPTPSALSMRTTSTVVCALHSIRKRGDRLAIEKKQFARQSASIKSARNQVAKTASNWRENLRREVRGVLKRVHTKSESVVLSRSQKGKNELLRQTRLGSCSRKKKKRE